MERERKRHEEGIEKERNVSAGLRDRIGALDEKRKRAQDDLAESKKREGTLQSEIDALRLARQHDLELAIHHPEDIAKDLTLPTSDAAVDSTFCITPSKRVVQKDKQPKYVVTYHTSILGFIPRPRGPVTDPAVHDPHYRSALRTWLSLRSRLPRSQTLPLNQLPQPSNESAPVQCRPNH